MNQISKNNATDISHYSSTSNSHHQNMDDDRRCAKIRQKLNEPQAENRKITEAQLKALEGKTEEAYTLYKEAYYYSVVTFFNELENKNLKDTEAKEKAWEEGFNEIVSYYSGQISRLGNYKLPEEALYTYAQISARIGKL